MVKRPHKKNHHRHSKYDALSPENKTLHRQFSEYLQTVGYSDSTIKQLPTYVKEFLHCMEQKVHTNEKSPFGGFRGLDVWAHYEYLQTRPNQTQPGGLSNAMIASHLFALRIFFKWMEETEIIKTNPMSALRFPYPEYKTREALTKEEIKKLYDAAETFRDKSMLGLFYGCGLRRSEAEQLNIEDIKLKEKLLIVREGKGKKRRVVPIAEKVKEDFENYHHHERPYYSISFGEGRGEAFMINSKGRRMTRDSYAPRLKYLAKKAGIEKNICLHQLRHSIATHLLEQGMSLEKVKEFLGHKYIDTTQRYTHVEKWRMNNGK